MALQQTPSGWVVYILECADGTLYCGVTTDLERRLLEHQGELPGGARYTRSRRPVRLAAWTGAEDRAAACRIESAIKRLPRAKKLAHMQSFSKGDNRES